MHIERLAISDVLLISPSRHGDDRGYFSEVYRSDLLAGYGVGAAFVQDNHVFSAERGVLRGLHFQAPPSEQGKLVRCTRGAIRDVAVDIRGGSPTFGHHVSIVLSAANWRQMWIPPGFAHGYVTLEAGTEVQYKVTNYYDPASDRGLAWDDPDLAIEWGVEEAEVILSPKDIRHPRLVDAPVAFRYER